MSGEYKIIICSKSGIIIFVLSNDCVRNWRDAGASGAEARGGAAEWQVTDMASRRYSLRGDGNYASVS